jgi:DNA-binding response OmpR family regulator
LANANILIVEDEAIVALELKYRLTKLGYDVCGTASTGSKAIQIAENYKPDLALMDVQIKGSLNGIEVASLLKDKFGIPSIFLSAFSDELTKQQMANICDFEHLQKPFEASELKNAIERMIEKKQIMSNKAS